MSSDSTCHALARSYMSYMPKYHDAAFRYESTYHHILIRCLSRTSNSVANDNNWYSTEVAVIRQQRSHSIATCMIRAKFNICSFANFCRVSLRIYKSTANLCLNCILFVPYLQVIKRLCDTNSWTHCNSHMWSGVSQSQTYSRIVYFVLGHLIYLITWINISIHYQWVSS